jgi:glycosyltransferase involved in cell wall biosynthesis
LPIETAEHSMPLKLLLISSYKDTWNSVRPEAELFIGLARAGLDVTLMTQGDAEYVPRFLEHGIRIIDFHPKKKLQWPAIRRIRKELKEGCYDVAYLFNNKAITNTLIAAAGLPVKLVSYRGQTGNIYRYDPSSYLTHLHPRLDGILCVANAVRDDLRKRSFLPRACIQTAYKGHDLAWYQDTPADLAEFDIPANAQVAVCVANDRPRKGLPVLLAATHRLADCDTLHLLLVGNGMDKPKIRKLIERSPMRARIHVAGFRRDAPALVAACQMSILASIKREGLPKTVIEAMAYGVTPIVTDTGGSAELLIDGESGYVVPPADEAALAEAIRRLYERPDQCRQMGVKARARIADIFNLENSVRDTRAFLEFIAGKPSH